MMKHEWCFYSRLIHLKLFDLPPTLPRRFRGLQGYLPRSVLLEKSLPRASADMSLQHSEAFRFRDHSLSIVFEPAASAFACLLACLLVCLFVCLFACALACWPLLACSLACAPACLLACRLVLLTTGKRSSRQDAGCDAFPLERDRAVESA